MAIIQHERMLQIVLTSFFLRVGKWDSLKLGVGQSEGSHELRILGQEERVSDISDLSEEHLFSSHSVLMPFSLKDNKSVLATSFRLEDDNLHFSGRLPTQKSGVPVLMLVVPQL